LRFEQLIVEQEHGCEACGARAAVIDGLAHDERRHGRAAGGPLTAAGRRGHWQQRPVRRFDLAFQGRVPVRGDAEPDGCRPYHVELDGSLVNMFCSPRDTVSLQNVKPGLHTLTFLAAENDHTDDMKSARKVGFVYQPTKALSAIAGVQKAPKTAPVDCGGIGLAIMLLSHALFDPPPGPQDSPSG
jgi:hypothetical protein